MKHRATRFIAVLCLSAALQPLMAQDADTPALVVIDLRPDSEKEGNGLAPLSGRCNDDVYRIADVATDPLKVDLLKEDLAPLLGTGGKTLTVLNWSIYYNKQVQKAGGLKGFGVQGYSVPTKDDKKKAIPKILLEPRNRGHAQEWMHEVMTTKFVEANGKRLRRKTCHIGLGPDLAGWIPDVIRRLTYKEMVQRRDDLSNDVGE